MIIYPSDYLKIIERQVQVATKKLIDVEAKTEMYLIIVAVHLVL